MNIRETHIDKLPKGGIHKVPEKYFDSLPMKIQERIQLESQSSPYFSIRMQWASALTAAIVFLFIGVYYFQSEIENPTQKEDLLAQVSAEDIIDYLESEDISILEIASAFDLNELLDEENPEYFELLEDELSNEELEFIYTEYDFSTDVL